MEVMIDPAKCLIWGCDKTIRDLRGVQVKGRRGMCWAHLKQAQRDGILKPAKQGQPPLRRVPCQCGKPWYRAGLCRYCYLRAEPGRLERDRDRKRKYMGRKKAA